MQRNFTFLEKDSWNIFLKIKTLKVRDYCNYTGRFRGAAHSTCNLRFNVPNEIPVVFPNVSNYDYHFIIKKLAKKFEEQLECLGENIKKYKTFSIPMEE